MTRLICKVLAERLYATDHDVFNADRSRYERLALHDTAAQKGALARRVDAHL